MNSNSITTILEIFENEPRISHRIIAENTDNLEVSVQNLINKHKNKLELFGRIQFENESETSVKLKQKAKPNYRAEKTFYLNEQQATLLLTFMRNNEIVINFKVRLVKEFFEMRQLLLNSEKPASQPVQTKNSQTFDIKSYTQQNRELIDLIELITSKNAITLHYLDKLTNQLNIKSPLDLLKIDLNSYYFIPTELGKFLNKSAVEINKMLEHKGFQFKENGEWFLTEKGQNFGFEFQNGSFKTIK